MINTLVFPLNYFQALLHLLAADPEGIACCVVGSSHLKTETLYLVRRVESAHALLSARDRENSISVSMAVDATQPFQSKPIPISETLGHLVIGKEALQGQWWGEIKDPSKATATLDRILLVGSGMHELKAANSDGKITKESQSSPIPMRQVYSRFSRTIGALGVRHWRRLVSLPITIVGCGRTGSIAAVTLAKLGVRSLTLIDPDVLEEHNLAEMDGVNDASVGRLKVEALADFLHAHCASADFPLNISKIPEPITTAQSAALTADVLFCCVDNDAARLACGILATLFHKVLIDIGTGVFDEQRQNRMMVCSSAIHCASEGSSDVSARSIAINHPTTNIGADVRLILPADGCLLCFGSVANYDEAIDILSRRNLSSEKRGEPWWVRRSGSLRTLNMMAVSLGIQLLGDLIAERVKNSRWVRLEYDENGRLTTQQVAFSATKEMQRCPLCIKAGLGDDGLLWCNQTINPLPNKWLESAK